MGLNFDGWGLSKPWGEENTLAIISSSRWHLHYSGHFLHDSLDGGNAPAWHAADPFTVAR